MPRNAYRRKTLPKLPWLQEPSMVAMQEIVLFLLNQPLGGLILMVLILTPQASLTQ